MVAGSRITANSICILRGSMAVPSSSPRAEVRMDAETRISANSAQLVTSTCGPWPGGAHPTPDGHPAPRGEEGLPRPGRDLLDGQHPDRDRGQGPVLDGALP